mgnify:CR=1 FL=1
MNKNYLPSKQFISRIIILAFILVLFFGIRAIVKYIQGRRALSNNPTKILVKDLVQQDTNKNDIPDWEESLWGLDPTKDGAQNKAVIMNKRAELAQKDEDFTIAGNETSKDNENLSKEFFATIVSLQQTGNLDDTAMNAISDAIGNKIVPTSMRDIYTSSMLAVRPTTDKTISDYINAFKKLNDKYSDKDIGNELIFISQGIKNNDPQALSTVKDIASSYRSFGKDLIKIPTPESISTYSLRLANDYEKVAQSIEGLTVLLEDPIIGMRSLINYKKYNDELLENIENISDNL